MAEFAPAEVVGVGLNATDTLISLPHFPAFNSKMHYRSACIQAGGQVASALVACQSWGLRTRYFGMVGDDPAADFQRREFAHAGVDAHLFAVPQCESQSAFILIDEASGERTILWRRDERLTMRAEMVEEKWIRGARVLHLDGHDTAAAASAARIARRMGIPVTLDVDNLYPGIEDLLASVDYVISSQEFPARITGQARLEAALPVIQRRYGCRVAGATLGAQGALVWDGECFHSCPGFRVAAVDTTGAGDIFHGAFVYGLLQGWPLPRNLEFSCAAASLSCLAYGARGGIRPVEEIERLRREGERTEPYEVGRMRELPGTTA